MEDELVLNGLHIASDVLETIVVMAVSDVDCVVALGATDPRNARKRNKARKAIDIRVEDDAVVVDVHVTLVFGFQLKKAADSIRCAVSDALGAQLGIEVAAVNVYIDSMKFPE